MFDAPRPSGWTSAKRIGRRTSFAESRGGLKRPVKLAGGGGLGLRSPQIGPAQVRGADHGPTHNSDAGQRPPHARDEGDVGTARALLTSHEEKLVPLPCADRSKASHAIGEELRARWFRGAHSREVARYRGPNLSQRPPIAEAISIVESACTRHLGAFRARSTTRCGVPVVERVVYGSFGARLMLGWSCYRTGRRGPGAP
jgi:hypothetical protein